MRDQVHNKKTSMSDHVQILETLREEITIMTERKMDLERRIEVPCPDYRQLGLTGVLAGSVHGEGGSELHAGRERGQDRDAGEGGEGARLSGERTSQSDQITSFDQRSDESDGWCWPGGWGDLTMIILCCRFGTSKKRVMN